MSDSGNAGLWRRAVSGAASDLGETAVHAVSAAGGVNQETMLDLTDSPH